MHHCLVGFWYNEFATKVFHIILLDLVCIAWVLENYTKPNLGLFELCEEYNMIKSKGKRKRDAAGADEQPKEQYFGLVTDTDYHTGSLFSRTFQQIYEDFRSGKAPEA